MNDLSTPFPICFHYGRCAGCSELLSMKPPPVWEEVLSFLPTLVPHLHMGSPLYWRHRAKVAVRGSSAHPLMGLFKRSSHDVVPIPECLVHHPHLNQAFNLVGEWIKKNEIIPYEEKTGTGELRYLQGVVQRVSGRVQLAFVFNSSPQVNRWRPFIEQLGKEHPHLWHSLWMNFNDRPINTIFGSQWLHVCGEEQLWEKFGDVQVCYGPESFGQANLALFERMLVRIRELLLPNACVVEFYAGVGVIGLFLAAHCQWVRCSEINSFAENYFHQSCARMPSSLSSRLSFFSGSTQNALSLLEGASTAIVDPPRKGLDSRFFTALKEASSVKQLLYISCGWDAFQQDCLKLCGQGWKVKSVDGYLFFPGSNHVELLVNFFRV